METIKLQYMLSSGRWFDCNDRTEEFLTLCEKNNGISDGNIVPRFRAEKDLTRDEVTAALLSGKQLRNDRSDWYSVCRNKPEPKQPVAVELVKCDCGHTIPKKSVMGANLGTSCPDCYDRMSD